jgi:hypothetical protein
LNCRIWRRPCSMTKKQYNTRKGTIGTVQKCIATRASETRATVWRDRPSAERAAGIGRRPPRIARNRAAATHRESSALPKPGFPVRSVGLMQELPSAPTDAHHGTGSPAPIQAETGTISANDRFGLDNHQHILPARRKMVQNSRTKGLSGGLGRFASGPRPAGEVRGPPPRHRCDSGSRRAGQRAASTRRHCKRSRLSSRTGASHRGDV